MPEPQAIEPQDALSPDQVAAGLAQAARPASPAAAPAASAPEPSTRPFDFRAPSFLSAAELRQLRQRHEEFVRAFSARLSVYLRLDLDARVLDLQTLSYRRFVERVAAPTHLTLFRIEPWSGLAWLEVAPVLGRALVDRLLGGPGKPANVEREFSELELELLDLAVHLLLKEWCQEAARQPDARPQVVAHESNPRFLPWSDPDASVLLVTLRLTLNETTGEIRLGLPGAMLESLRRQLNAALEVKPSSAAPCPPAAAQWQPHLNEVPVALHAAWTGLEITVRELAHLRVGDVLPIAPHHLNRVQICVGRMPKFCGRLGTRERAWAIELTGAL